MATSQTDPTTVGVYFTRAAADRAVAGLKADGYRDDQIGHVAVDGDGTAAGADGPGDANVAEGAAIGAAAGVGLGGLAVLAGVIPVVGPALALGTVLINAACGAAVGGALAGLDGPEPGGEPSAGRHLVTVEGGTQAADARVDAGGHGG